MTTQCEKLQVLTLRNPYSCEKTAIDGRPSQTYFAVMTTRDTIMNKLREAFIPESLEVADESHLHEGHAGQSRRRTGPVSF